MDNNCFAETKLSEAQQKELSMHFQKCANHETEN